MEKESPSVRRWLAGSVAPPARQAQWLDVLQRFCDARGTDPDGLIAQGSVTPNAKNDVMRHLVRWAAEQSDDERTCHQMQNVIRGFFNRNGLRVVTKPYPDVYRRQATG